MSKMTRRSMLGTGSALAAIPLALSTGAASTGHDPIYAAIEAHRRAEQTLRDFVGKRIEWETSIGGYTDEHGNDYIDYEVVAAHPDWAKWQCAEEAQPDASEERIALLETVPATLTGLAALLEYVWESEVGGYLLGSADEMAIFLESMHYAANSFAGLPAPTQPRFAAAMMRRGRMNARENARCDAAKR